MSGPSWWLPAVRGRDLGETAQGGRPILAPGGRARMLADLQRRIASFTPEWRRLSGDDAGVALVRVFGSQLDQVLLRLEKLPDKALVDFLSAAGIALAPARPATARVRFKTSGTASGPVQVPQGIQLTSPPADDSAGDVVWETDAALSVQPAEIAEVLSDDGEMRREIDTGFAAPFSAFGTSPSPGALLMIGLDAEVAPRGEIAIAFETDRLGAAPPPVAAGGTEPSARAVPALVWEAFTPQGFRRTEVVADGTDRLRADGIVRLRAPRGWTPGRPADAGSGDTRYWIRVRLTAGGYVDPPLLSALRLNAVAVTASETIRDEIPEPLGRNPVRFRLSQTPVVPGSLTVEVDEGVSAALFDIPDNAPEPVATGYRVWEEVETLAGRAPDERVYTVDPASGELRFGNDVNGMAPPEGRRSVIVHAYRVASGRASAVEADTITGIRRKLPGLASVTNPRPATGGSDAEILEEAVRRGPAQVKARGRAVTWGDIETLATRADGADIARAFARPLADPAQPGAQVPGTVGVYVLPNRRPGDLATTPPLADSATLKAVSQYLAGEIGPLGARIVAAAPRFHEVRVETTVEVDPAADPGSAVTAVLNALDRYLDPYDGGEDGTGWKLGVPLRHSRLVRQMIEASDAVRSVLYLNVVRDRLRFDLCADVPIAPDGLPWPGAHDVVATLEGTT